MVEKKTRKRTAKPKPPAEEPLFKPSDKLFVAGPVPTDGTLIREDGDPTVYVMDKGQRRPFADLDAFHACFGGGASITTLTHEEIDPITVGDEVTSLSDLQGEGA